MTKSSLAELGETTLLDLQAILSELGKWEMEEVYFDLEQISDGMRIDQENNWMNQVQTDQEDWNDLFDLNLSDHTVLESSNVTVEKQSITNHSTKSKKIHPTDLIAPKVNSEKVVAIHPTVSADHLKPAPQEMDLANDYFDFTESQKNKTSTSTPLEQKEIENKVSASPAFSPANESANEKIHSKAPAENEPTSAKKAKDVVQNKTGFSTVKGFKELTNLINKKPDSFNQLREAPIANKTNDLAKEIEQQSQAKRGAEFSPSKQAQQKQFNPATKEATNHIPHSRPTVEVKERQASSNNVQQTELDQEEILNIVTDHINQEYKRFYGI